VKINISFMFPEEYRFAHFLYDAAKVLLHGLEDLGHHVILTRQLVDADYLNILVGGHAFDSPDSVQQLASAGIPYVVFQTEIIRGETINTTGEDRFRLVYRPLLEGAAAVWDSYESNKRALAEHGIEADLVDLGYHPAMEVIRHKADKDLDVFFFGSIGPRRAGILQALQDRGLRVAAMFDDPAFFRNDMIGRAKLHLSLRHGDEMTHMPLWRIKFLVNNRCLVVSETATESESVDGLFVPAEPENLIEVVEATLAREDRDALAQSFYESYRERPMKAALEPLMAKLAAT
jgi:hypothetical protein